MSTAVYPALAHARGCLRAALRHPGALLGASCAPAAMLPIMQVVGTLPTPLLLLVGGASGALAEFLLQAVLVRSERFPRGADGPPAMPTLPLSPRQRAVGAVLAATPILALGALLATTLQLAMPALLLSEPSPSPSLPQSSITALTLVLLPATIGASLQAGRGGLAQLFGIAGPGLIATAAWRLGLLPSPVHLLTLVAITSAVLLAVGPLPGPRLDWPPPPAGGPLSRTAREAPAMLAADFRSGLLHAHLKATPLALVAFVPWALTGGSADLGPAFYASMGVTAVAFGAAMMPLGRSPFGTGLGPLSPWASLPLDRHQVARWLYLHAILCLLLLPATFLALAVATERLDGFILPVVVLLGLPLAAPVAGVLTAVWLSQWHRAIAGVIASSLVVGLMRPALSTASPTLLAAIAVLSLIVSVLPIADLLRDHRPRPAPA